jgi:hypothetical protein
MSPLERTLADYLATRRALGFALRETGSGLRNFCRVPPHRRRLPHYAGFLHL